MIIFAYMHYEGEQEPAQPQDIRPQAKQGYSTLANRRPKGTSGKIYQTQRQFNLHATSYQTGCSNQL